MQDRFDSCWRNLRCWQVTSKNQGSTLGLLLMGHVPNTSSRRSGDQSISTSSFQCGGEVVICLLNDPSPSDRMEEDPDRRIFGWRSFPLLVVCIYNLHHSFGHYPEHTMISEGRDIYWLLTFPRTKLIWIVCTKEIRVNYCY